MNPGKTWVKVCGVTRVEDAKAAVRAGADAIGVNFVETSRRYCDLDTARRIVAAVEADVIAFGVFANASREHVGKVLERTGIGGLQFHGGEADEEMVGWTVPVLRAVAVGDTATLRAALEAAGGWRVLLDSPRGGGSGIRFDVELARGLDLSSAIVAGGLAPANVAEVVAQLKPWGVDVAGGVEDGVPGVKSISLMEEFVSNARSA